VIQTARFATHRRLGWASCACIALSSSIAVTSVVVPAAYAAKTPLPRFQTCTGSSVVKPKDVVLHCKGTTTSLSNVKWHTWTAKGARATATLIQNSCTKSCAKTQATKRGVTVYLRDPIPGHVAPVFYITQLVYQINHKTHKDVWINHQLYVPLKKATPTSHVLAG
jgi:hypothetical protein